MSYVFSERFYFFVYLLVNLFIDSTLDFWDYGKCLKPLSDLYLVLVVSNSFLFTKKYLSCPSILHSSK